MTSKAKEILIRARKNVFSNNMGDSIATLKGEGLDFREIRDYVAGDDIRKINWKATAKSGDTKVNVFNQEQELNIVVVFLSSGSMNFGSYKLKQDVASEALALLGFSSIYSNNKLQSFFFDDKLSNFYPSSKDETTAFRMLDDALALDCLQKEVNYEKLCEFINMTIAEKSLLFLVGDFYGDIDLKNIAYKHEVYCINIRDHFEEYPYLNGNFDFIDPVSFDSSNITMTKSIAKKYNKLIVKNDEKIKSHFLNHGIKYEKIYTNDNVFEKLSKCLRG